VPSARPLFVRSPVAAAGAFRFYRIPVMTFTARIFLGSSWHRPLRTAAQIVRDASHACICRKRVFLSFSIQESNISFMGASKSCPKDSKSALRKRKKK